MFEDLDTKIQQFRLNKGFETHDARRILLSIAKRLASDHTVRQRGAILLLEASTPLRKELLKAAAIFLQLSGDRLPAIHLTRVSEDDQISFDFLFPDFFRVMELHRHRGGAEDVSQGEISHPDVALFALDEDDQTIEAAERFRSDHGFPENRICICLRQSSPINDCLSMALREDEVEDPLDVAMEEGAMMLHETYCSENPGQMPPWDQLSESSKESNRLAVAHNAVKQEAWLHRAPYGEAAMIDHLARCEHQRWMAEKVMNSWKWSGSFDPKSRDNARLLHHLLIPYDQLSQEEKDKDKTVVRNALA